MVNVVTIKKSVFGFGSIVCLCVILVLVALLVISNDDCASKNNKVIADLVLSASNIYVFSPGDESKVVELLKHIDTIQAHSGPYWGTSQFALLFEKGEYNFGGETLSVNFYTSLRGLV